MSIEAAARFLEADMAGVAFRMRDSLKKPVAACFRRHKKDPGPDLLRVLFDSQPRCGLETAPCTPRTPSPVFSASDLLHDLF